MRAFLSLLLLLPPLFGATLLNQNLYERENRVDLMLSFDTPFKGSVKKSVAGDGTINIRLPEVRILKPFSKEMQNRIVESVSITSTGKSGALIKITPTDRPVKVQASKTVDGFGLRLRVLPAETATSSAVLPGTLKSEQKPLNTLKSGETLPSWRYWSVLGILSALLLFLWIVKRKRFGAGGGPGWLMPKSVGAKLAPEGAVIRYQKPLDRQNRLLLLEFDGRQYLIVVGSSNLLLDRFTNPDERVEDAESFTSLFEANKKQLDHFLKENHPDAYEAFKANASKDDRL